jgi:hypothetical protein
MAGRVLRDALGFFVWIVIEEFSTEVCGQSRRKKFQEHS